MELRPIGTEFDIIYPPDYYMNTEPKSHKVTYRVIGHVKSFNGKWDKIGRWAEEVTTIKCEDISKGK